MFFSTTRKAVLLDADYHSLFNLKCFISSSDVKDNFIGHKYLSDGFSFHYFKDIDHVCWVCFILVFLASFFFSDEKLVVICPQFSLYLWFHHITIMCLGLTSLLFVSGGSLRFFRCCTKFRKFGPLFLKIYFLPHSVSPLLRLQLHIC